MLRFPPYLFTKSCVLIGLRIFSGRKEETLGPQTTLSALAFRLHRPYYKIMNLFSTKNKYSGTSLKRTPSKADTSLRRFPNQPLQKNFSKADTLKRRLLKADTFSRSRTAISSKIYLSKADREKNCWELTW